MAVALDHAAQAQALVQPGQLVRVLHARVGEVEGNPFAEPGLPRRASGRRAGIGEDDQLGQQVAVGRVLHGQRAAGEGLGDIHRAQGAADGVVIEVAGHGAEVLAGDQQRGGQAPERALGGRPPLLLAFGEVDQLAAERHVLFRHAGGRRDGAAVFNA